MDFFPAVPSSIGFSLEVNPKLSFRRERGKKKNFGSILFLSTLAFPESLDLKILPSRLNRVNLVWLITFDFYGKFNWTIKCNYYQKAGTKALGQAISVQSTTRLTSSWAHQVTEPQSWKPVGSEMKTRKVWQRKAGRKGSGEKPRVVQTPSNRKFRVWCLKNFISISFKASF